MKIDAFQGYTQYREKEYIFMFDNYELKLIPCSYDNLIENQTTHGFKALTKLKKNGWINNFILEGCQFDGTQVVFCVQDSPGFKDGIFSYKVKWLYINTLKYGESIRIKGINFISQEINSFYSIKKYITDDFSLENGCYKEYQLNIKALNQTLLGNFRFSNYGVKIFGDMSFRQKYSSNERLEMWSKLILELSRELTQLDKLYELVILQLNVINFLTYRLNNTFDMIETYIYDEHKRKYPSGRFYIDYKCEPECDYENIKHLINSDNIPNLGELYKIIYNNKVYMAHLCSSYSKWKTYDPAHILGIMIAFERLFRWQYGINKIRSDDYLELLDRIKINLEKNKDDICRDIKRKRNFKKIVKRLSEPQVSYGDYISHVIKDIPLCERYIKNLYSESNVNAIIDNVSERVNKFRNDMAHGNIDVDITINHTKDLKLLERMIFIMILNYLGLTEDEIIKKINWLFSTKNF